MWTEAVSGNKNCGFKNIRRAVGVAGGWGELRCVVTVSFSSSSLVALSRKTIRDMDDFEFVENRWFDGKRATKTTRHAYDYWSNRLGDIERAI